MKKRTFLKRFLITVSVFIVLITLCSYLFHATGMQARRRLNHIESLIDQNTGTLRLGLSKTYHLASLSFLSEGLVHYSKKYPKEAERIDTLFQKINRSALDRRNGNYSIWDQSTWDEDNLYISHIGIILLSYEKSTGNDQYAKLLDTIVRDLKGKLRNSQYKNIRSYSRSTSVWPADNSLMYQLIFEHETLRKLPVDSTFSNTWISYMKEHGSDSLGLHLSELTSNEYYSAFPRGCALSWSASYMAHFNPNEAKQFWKTYKREMKVPLIFWAGFREYPSGRSCKGDGDSGPIIMGVGGGATGLAITGAGANSDFITFNQLNSTMNLIEVATATAKLFGEPKPDELVNGLLPSCIKFKGEMLMLR